jgi:predicted transcriptional regulator
VINPRDAIVYKSSPEMQIVGYLQATGLSWGVLTNGIQ